MFDVSMGSFDGAEVCELVGLFILNTQSAMFGADKVGLYRDDGLILLPGTGGRLTDQTRKQLHGIFDQFSLKITIEVSHQSVNYLDVTFDLANDSYRPCRKRNSKPLYIKHSNHPPSINRQLPVSIIDHEVLLSKLRAYGVDDLTLPWFRSYLADRRQRCFVNGQFSHSSFITKGVPQGSIIGPLLFLVYTNYLPNCLNEGIPRMFADDTNMSFSSNTLSVLKHLINFELQSLNRWLITNKFKHC